MTKTVLITGGTGFLGSYLTYGLLHNGFHVVVLKRSTSATWRIIDFIDEVKCYDIDIVGIEPAFKDQYIDTVIHTACCYGRKNEKISDIVDTNVMFGINLLEYAEVFNTNTFINTDTFYATSLIPKYKSYALSKRHFVEWLKQASKKVKIVNMKLEHMYGPKDDKTKFIPWVLDQLDQNKKEINLTSGIQERDFIYVTDVVSAYKKILECHDKLDTFNEFDVGTGKSTSVKQFITELHSQYKKLNPENITDLLFGKIPHYENEPMHVTVDINSLISIGWKPEISFKEGIRGMLAAAHPSFPYPPHPSLFQTHYYFQTNTQI
ncbi:paratose synthase [Spirochaetia bacterium]|nr:paratose synthase [Spirochaetia bacterium]